MDVELNILPVGNITFEQIKVQSFHLLLVNLMSMLGLLSPTQRQGRGTARVAMILEVNQRRTLL